MVFNKTMKKNLSNYPKSLQTVRKWFPRIEWVSPKLAGAIAKKLFFTPLRYEAPQREKETADIARQFNFSYKNHSLQGYEWGKDGPVVLLLHGWSGRATQFSEFVSPLVEEGYKVVAFDAPGHNASPGKYSDLVYFSESLTALANQYSNVHSVIAHSMGGIATLYALQHGLKIETAILIGTPSIAADILKNFTLTINSSEKIERVIDDYIKKTYGKPFAAFHTLETGKHASIPVLVIHDEHDKEVSVRDARALIEVLKQGELLITQGLGHTKILRDAGVIDSALSFIKKESPALMKIKKAV